MTPEQWLEVQDVLASALDLSETVRFAYVAKACAGRPAILMEVEALLAADRDGGDFIEAAIAGQVGWETQHSLAGRRIGPYKLLKEQGRGGMAVVYRAERDDEQFSKDVAIKLISAGVTSMASLRRFREERQILATLEHPNIARLLDGGVTADGLHYIVMEYVEGVPINQYCDRKALPVEERLKLFQAICSAVHCAHQYLVVHRDIKPSNILVTAEGMPKLLDFGIAKILTPTADPSFTQVSHTLAHMMTPDYASPEQVRGEPVTTSTDVYSLGVLLYELLTGHKPYTLQSTLPHEIAKVICESEPQKPSTAISRVNELASSDGYSRVSLTAESVSKARGSEPEKLRRRLAGDLDNIVLTAIRKESRRRYSSVEQFSEDIRRHLEGFPVRARKDRMGYRAGKFIQRHIAAVVAAALVFVTLIVGIIATTWQARIARVQRARAEQRFNDVRRLANSFMFDLENEIQNLPGTTHVQEMLVKTALQYLDSLGGESNDDPSLQRELATAYQRVGDIEGLRGIQNLGNTSAALESYRKALRIRQMLAYDVRSDSRARNELAFIHTRIANILELRNDLVGALDNDYKSLELRQAASNANRSDRSALLNLAVGYGSIGRHLRMKGDWVGALTNDLKASSIFESQLAITPTDERLRHGMAVHYGQVAFDLKKNGNWGRALDYYRKEQAICEALVAAHPNSVGARLDLSGNYQHMGSLFSDAADFEKSLENWRKGLTIDQAVAEADPKDSRAKLGLATSLNRVGWLLVKTGRASGVEDLRRGLEIREGLYAADPTNPRRRDTLANSYATLGEAEVMLALSPRTPSPKRITHWRDARSWYKRALKIYVELRAEGALRAEDAGEPDSITRDIAKCNAALGKV